MSIEKINAARAEISESAAFQTVTAFFDEGSFCEIDAFAKSGEGFAEAVAGWGTVNGMPVYAFAQNSGMDGALSKAQAAKLKKLYSLALKTGTPVVGFYDSVGGYLNQGTELLGGLGEVLRLSAKVSGAVPQVSVILGSCLGTNALCAANADFVIMTKDSKLSLTLRARTPPPNITFLTATSARSRRTRHRRLKRRESLCAICPQTTSLPLRVRTRRSPTAWTASA